MRMIKQPNPKLISWWWSEFVWRANSNTAACRLQVAPQCLTKWIQTATEQPLSPLLLPAVCLSLWLIGWLFVSRFAASRIQSDWASVALGQEPGSAPLPHEDLCPQPCGGQVPLLVFCVSVEEDEEGVRGDCLLWPGEWSNPLSVCFSFSVCLAPKPKAHPFPSWCELVWCAHSNTAACRLWLAPPCFPKWIQASTMLTREERS